MKKIILLLIMVASATLANTAMDPMSNITSNNELQGKKRYKELIKFLEHSPSGEYAMYLGIIYLNGIVTPDAFGDTVIEDIKKAEFFFKKSIDLNYFKTSAILGSLYLFDVRFKKIKDSDKLAKYYLSMAVEKGLIEATMALSSYYFYYEKDSKKAMELLHLGAKNNLSTAQLALATTYAYGAKDMNIEKDQFLGNRYLNLACSNKEQTTYVKKFCSSSYIIKGDK